jgi:hypothetical protein
LLSVLIAAVFSLKPVASSTWIKISAPHFFVFAETKEVGKKTASQAEAAYRRTTRELNFAPEKKISVFVFSNEKAFKRISPSPEAVGFADPKGSRIYVLERKDDFDSVLRHEISHIVFLQSVPKISGIPFWFIEGLAIYQSEPFSTSLEVQRRALRGDLKSVSELSRIRPTDPEEEERVSSEGYLLVKYIVERFGQSGLFELVGRLQAGESFSQALRNSTGVDEQKLNALWQSKVRQERSTLLWEGLRNVGLIALALLALIALMVLARRRRRFVEETEEYEEYEDGGEDEY